MDYYTSTLLNKGKVYVRGIENGKQKSQIVDYSPYVFLNSNKPTGYKTIYDVDVQRKDFANITEAKNFIKEYDGVQGMDIYGLTNFPYVWMYDTFKGDIQYNPKDVSVVSLDIENSMKIPCDISTAIVETPNQITAITISRNGKTASFGIKDFDDSGLNDFTYYKCDNENHLLRTFISIWCSSDFNPDIITGWNVECYDIPYLVNRIIRVLGEDYAKKLSPWGILRDYEILVKGKYINSYNILGITVLDYMIIYKKFILKKQEKYSLEHIAMVELGEGKLDYSEYEGLDDMYDRDFQKYLTYNIRDVHLIDRLEAKLKLIELVMAIAYMAKVNYSDCMSSVKKWDVMIHNYLMDKNIVVEPSSQNTLNRFLVGGYVREPIVGMHSWSVYFDLTSLYPHLIMWGNISPEKLVRRRDDFMSIDNILDGGRPTLNENTLCGNGVEFKRDSQGIFPEIMKKIFKDRKSDKDLMLSLKKEYEKTKNPALLNDISRFDNSQGAKKVVLNEFYGALANVYNRWFSFDSAEAITMSGQLAIRWIEKKINEYFNKLLKTENYEYVFYLDTDSAIIRLDKLVQLVMPNETDNVKITKFLNDMCDTKLNKYIADSYQELADIMNAYEQSLHMKMDSISSRFCLLAKKKYLMNVYNQEGVAYQEPELKMTGIQAIQSSTPQICKDALKASFKIIMNGTEKDLQSHVANFYDKFVNYKFEDIAFPGGISMTNYKMNGDSFAKGTPFRVKGALMYNKLIKQHSINSEQITDGDKIKYCYLKVPNPIRVNVISTMGELPKEFGLDEYVDYETQYSKSFIKPLEPILNTVNWSTEKRATLDSFFE